MAKKKNAEEEIYRHVQLVQDSDFGQNVTITGFAVNTSLRADDMKHIRHSFRSDFLSVLLVIDGRLDIKINMENYVLQKNSMLVAGPNAIKQLIDVSADSKMSAISFTPDFISEMGLPENTSEIMGYFSARFHPHWQLTEEDAKKTLDIFDALDKRCMEIKKHPYGRELLKHTFLIMTFELAALGKSYAAINQNYYSRKDALVIGFVNLVQLHFRHQRNVKQYAGQLFVTPKYLTETVKEITGKNAGEIIDDFVMLEAKLLLDDHKRSIAQVAEVLNFSDQSFFGKFFKRHSGLSPKEYRQLR